MTGFRVHFLYFAWLRERIGRGEEEIEVPGDIRTLGALSAWLAARGPGYASAFAAGKAVRAAVNQSFAGPEAAIGPGDEVAFFPPVTGG